MNKLYQRLRAGIPQFGLQVSYPAPGIVERIGRNWDWVWIDAQHGQFGYQDVLALVRTCDHMGCAPVVRVASHEYAVIGMALDTNPAGLIVPMVARFRLIFRTIPCCRILCITTSLRACSAW